MEIYGRKLEFVAPLGGLPGERAVTQGCAGASLHPRLAYSGTLDLAEGGIRGSLRRGLDRGGRFGLVVSPPATGSDANRDSPARQPPLVPSSSSEIGAPGACLASHRRPDVFAGGTGFV